MSTSERLAEVEGPLEHAREVISTLSEEEKLQALNAHPAIGAKRLAALGGGAGLRLGSNNPLRARVRNQVYEEKFGPVRRLRRRTPEAGDPSGAQHAWPDLRRLDTGLQRARRNREDRGRTWETSSTFSSACST